MQIATVAINSSQDFVSPTAFQSALVNPAEEGTTPTKTRRPSPTLEDLNIGVGRWKELKDLKRREEEEKEVARNSTIVPVFVTYATRLLIRYDDGVSSWWREKLDAYSLLAADAAGNKLGKDFGSMARSVQMALEDYVGHVQDDDTNTTIPARRRRFSELANIFVDSYSRKHDDSSMNDNIRRQISILFTILPREYQPIQVIKNLTAMDSTGNVTMRKHSESTTSIDSMTKLLPSEYRCSFDEVSNAFTIIPSIALDKRGVYQNFGEYSIATKFGPLSSKPLKRERPSLPWSIYALFGISGAVGCALTHVLVIPFDVVKTRLQTNPERYSNIFDGAVQIARTEGIQAFLLGGKATLAGYWWYGMTVYPVYALVKWYIGHSLLTAAVATAHTNSIALIAGAVAAVVASIGLTPMEACRIRTVAEPEVYRDIGLLRTMGVISTENSALGWRRLYSGLYPMLVRQVTFGSVKFLAFERAQDVVFVSFPELQIGGGATLAALGVSLACGAFSGALSSVLSQPADSVLTYVSKNLQKGGGLGIIESARMMVKNDGAISLFRGWGSRCLWATLIISGQFCLYDIFRNLFGINSEDLMQVFQLLINSHGIS